MNDPSLAESSSTMRWSSPVCYPALVVDGWRCCS